MDGLLAAGPVPLWPHSAVLVIGLGPPVAREARVWRQGSHPPQGSRAWRFCPMGPWARV